MKPLTTPKLLVAFLLVFALSFALAFFGGRALLMQENGPLQSLDPDHVKRTEVNKWVYDLKSSVPAWMSNEISVVGKVTIDGMSYVLRFSDDLEAVYRELKPLYGMQVPESQRQDFLDDLASARNTLTKVGIFDCLMFDRANAEAFKECIQWCSTEVNSDAEDGTGTMTLTESGSYYDFVQYMEGVSISDLNALLDSTA